MQKNRHFVTSNVAVVQVKHIESSDDVSQTSSVREKIRAKLRKRVKEKIKLNVQVGIPQIFLLCLLLVCNEFILLIK
jgi:hypothetical protein